MGEFIESGRKLIVSGELENAETVARPYSTSVRIIPTAVTFTWTQGLADSDWSLSTVDVAGPRPKADGSPSKNHASATFRADTWADEDPPQWLVDLAGATLAIIRNGDSALGKDGQHG